MMRLGISGALAVILTGCGSEPAMGMDMYRAPGRAADAIAFHADALTKAGFAPRVGAPKQVRDTLETTIAGGQ